MTHRPHSYLKALAALSAIAGLTTACGTATKPSRGTAVARSVSYQARLSYAKCMRAHGLTRFPNPSTSSSSASPPMKASPGSPAARAAHACEHLLAPTHASTSSTPKPSAATTDCLTANECYAPRQFRAAYGVRPLLSSGITGRGQTVVLLEFPPSASTSGQGSIGDIRQDLAEFDHKFGLPGGGLRVVNSLAHSASPWQATLEEVQDTEIVHAIAPGARIRELLIPSPIAASPNAVADAVVNALRLALTQGAVVSFSGGAGEQCFTPAVATHVNAALQAARDDHVTVVVSTGDSGAASTACPPATGSSAAKGVDLPASDPLALAVGGTTLHANPRTGAYISEAAWGLPSGSAAPTGASGGGFSRLFSRPTYQNGIPDIPDARGVPDVAADANPDTGMALAISKGGRNDVPSAGGVSAAAPLWAAIIALADQYVHRNLGFVNPALYRIARSSQYHRAFHDITTGTNTISLGPHTITGYHTAPGWDPVTGWGSPNAQALIPLLARYATP